MKTLVIGPSWVGDMMMSHSFYRTLKKEYPLAEIDVMAPSWCSPLLVRMPEVNQVLTMPIGHGKLALTARHHLGSVLHRSQYQRAYVLPNSFKSALIPFFAKIPQRIGWRGEMRYGLLTDLRILNKTHFPLMVERYVALAYNKHQIQDAKDLPSPLLWPQLYVENSEITEALLTFGLSHHRPIIGFCPGAEFGPAKRWPHYHYAQLAEWLIKAGYSVILLGSINDQTAGEQICAALSAEAQRFCFNLAGKTQLEQAVVLLAACHAVVSNDSGLMHIAAALKKPLIALYGPSSPDFTPPLSHHAKVIRLTHGYHKIRKGDTALGYHQSLIDIPPRSVCESLMSLLDTLKESTCAY